MDGRKRKNSPHGIAADDGILQRLFLYWSELELRHDNDVYRYIADCYLYPCYTLIPKLRRNGMKGSFIGIAPQKLMKALLSDSRVETILKCGRKRDLKHFFCHPLDLDFCWPSYRIALRTGYHIEDVEMWVDYLRLLDRCGKDLRNAHYVCPADLKAEHDRYLNKANMLREQEKRTEQIRRARENEARFKELKGKFSGWSSRTGQSSSGCWTVWRHIMKRAMHCTIV